MPQNKYTEHLTKAIMKAESDIILYAMPENAILGRCSMTEHGQGGKRVYSYEGEPFLELYPVKFETSIDDYGNTVIRGNQEYRVIRPDRYEICNSGTTYDINES